MSDENRIVPLDGVQSRKRLEVPQPWERQDGESNPAFAAFTLYLALGPERCLRVVAEQCAKSETLIRRWSARLNWRERATLFDRFEARAIHERLLAQMARLRERDLKTADALDEKTRLRLNTMRTEEIDNLSPMELAAFIRVSTDLKYKACDVSMEEVAMVDGFPTNLPVPQFIIQVISPGRDAEGRPMVGVQLPDGRCGYIPEAQIERFRLDFPDARVLA